MWLTGQSVRLILGGLVAVGVLIPMWRSSVEAVPITLQGQSADLGNLLVRQTLQGDFGTTCTATRGANGKCVPASVFTFNNAPAPLSDGILTVVAAGDVGHRQGERDQAGFVVTDFVTVFNPNKDPIGTLYSSTIPNCPGAGETGGFQADKTTVCGPNIHSVKPTGTDDAPGGSNGVDFFTDQLAQANRGDSITINQAELALLAQGGSIVLTFFPNPGTGNGGVGDIKYKSATLTYNGAVPEAASLILVALGFAVLVGEEWRKRQKG